MIFRKETIRAKYYHTKEHLEVDLKTDEGFKRLKDLEQEFSSHMKKLREIKIIREHLVPLALYLLDLDFEIEHEKKKEKEELRLKDVVGSLKEYVQKYIEDLGENAYTALNAATDLGTHAPTVAGPFLSSGRLQERISARYQALLEALNKQGEAGLGDLMKRELELTAEE